MQTITQKIEALNWVEVIEQLNCKGYAKIDTLIADNQCDSLIELYLNPLLFRKTIVMERYRFGLGEYKYFNYPLPNLIHEIRAKIYEKLAPIANNWMEILKLNVGFPEKHSEFLEKCIGENQKYPTVLMLKYGQGGFNTLHQDLYGKVFFPFQIVVFLNKPNEDYFGGEFVLTQQVPRAQSKAMVLKPEKGDVLIITTNFRPIKGTKGYYRAAMRHGVAEVIKGTRNTLGIIFHDATT